MERRVWVLYVTFRRDLEWLDYSLESIWKYARGFSGITVVVPSDQVNEFIHLEAKYGTKECPLLIKNFLEYPGKGFVHHLAMKCYGDVFCPEATHVLHLDPDCLFHEPVCPDDYFCGEKPVVVMESYELLKSVHPNRHFWKYGVEEALGFPVEYETMCRHPMVFHAWLYRNVRDHIERRHITPFSDYVLKQKNSFPQGFCEFDTLGGYAYVKHFGDYHWVDRGVMGEAGDPPPKLTQMWAGHTTPAYPENWKKIKRILE